MVISDLQVYTKVVQGQAAAILCIVIICPKETIYLSVIVVISFHHHGAA